MTGPFGHCCFAMATPAGNHFVTWYEVADTVVVRSYVGRLEMTWPSTNMSPGIDTVAAS